MPDEASVEDVDYGEDDVRLERSQKIPRRYILAFYWVVVILAIPFWWRSTSITRHSMPERRVQEQSRLRVCPLNTFSPLGPFDASFSASFPRKCGRGRRCSFKDHHRN